MAPDGECIEDFLGATPADRAQRSILDTASAAKEFGAGIAGVLLTYAGTGAMATQLLEPAWVQWSFTIGVGTLLSAGGYLLFAHASAETKRFKDGLSKQQEMSIPFQDVDRYDGIPFHCYNQRTLMTGGPGLNATHTIIRTPGEEELLLVDRHLTGFLAEMNTYKQRRTGFADLPKKRHTEQDVVEELTNRNVIERKEGRTYRTGEAYHESAVVGLRFAPPGIGKVHYCGLCHERD